MDGDTRLRGAVRELKGLFLSTHIAAVTTRPDPIHPAPPRPVRVERTGVEGRTEGRKKGRINKKRGMERSGVE